MSLGFVVVPKENCPHILETKLRSRNFSPEAFSTVCDSCQDGQENWVCLVCYSVQCSSYINSHMLQHYSETGHSTVLSLKDLSIWCYLCDSYITSPKIEKFVRRLSDVKYAGHNNDKEDANPEENKYSVVLTGANIEDGDQIRVDELQKELEAAKNARVVDGMYAITPKDDCPHVTEVNLASDYRTFEDILVNTACTDCENTNENWVCLKCGIVKCSRYVNEHMLMHAIESSHALALSFSDLSFWCYHCESYIVDLDLTQIYRLFQDKKFGKAHPSPYNSTAHVSEEEKIEYFDTEEELDAKIETLATWIRESNYFIAFTGAGISTSAGIPDYRSGFNTVLPTGAGCWERKAAKDKKAPKASVRTSILKAVPTLTHMSMLELVNAGYLKSVLSQNVDGLHRKSGIPVEKIAELHGNANVERCKKCGMEYMRDYGVRNNPDVHMHETGNYCDNPACGGVLVDTIINFGENLDESVLQKCSEDAGRSDLCLAMGSSLRVNPAALFPKEVAKHGKLVIVNLQKTPLDKYALCIHALCDVVMEKLMKKLGLTVPEFRLIKRIGISNQNHCVLIRGLDFNGAPYSILKKVTFKGRKDLQVLKEPFFINDSQKFTKIVLEFQGHYGESAYELDINSNSITNNEQIFDLAFDPVQQVWL